MHSLLEETKPLLWKDCVVSVMVVLIPKVMTVEKKSLGSTIRLQAMTLQYYCLFGMKVNFNFSKRGSIMQNYTPEEKKRYFEQRQNDPNLTQGQREYARERLQQLGNISSTPHGGCKGGKAPARNYGWALTKHYPHKRHPAFWRRKGKSKDDIEYLTFTHSSKVELDDEGVVETLPLTDNISPAERKKNATLPAEERRISYVMPFVYDGERSALGEKTEDFSFVPEDYKLVQEHFNTLPRKTVPKTGGKGNNRQKNKPPK